MSLVTKDLANLRTINKRNIDPPVAERRKVFADSASKVNKFTVLSFHVGCRSLGLCQTSIFPVLGQARFDCQLHHQTCNLN